MTDVVRAELTCVHQNVEYVSKNLQMDGKDAGMRVR